MRVPSPVIAVAALVVVVAGLILIVGPSVLPGLRDTAVRPAADRPSLALLTQWVSGGALSDSDLVGKPSVFVLVDDTEAAAEPALLAAERWHRAFSPHARVIAVHVPSYAFAVDSGVPARLARRLGLTLPMASDAGLRMSARLVARRDAPAFALFEAGGEAVDVADATLAEIELSIRERLSRIEPPITPTPFMPLPSLPLSHRIELGAGRVPKGPLAKREAGEEPMFSAQFRYQEQGLPGAVPGHPL